MSELTGLTAAQTAERIAGGEVSAVEVARAHLDRIDAVDAKVHAFLHVDTDGALAAAAAVDARRAAGEALGPLAGVPLALKDVLTMEGVPTTCGSQDPRRLAPAVRRHRRPPAPRGRRRDPRQDQHGRVRDGLVDRELRVRPDPQPVGPRPDPRRLLGRLVGGGRRVRGAAGDRHRHRRLDPPAGGGHRHRRRQADLRRGLPLRPRRLLLLARPGRPVRPHRARRRPAARGDRRPRPARLHVHRRAGPGRRRGGPPRRRPGHAHRRRRGAGRRGLPARGAAALRRGRRRCCASSAPRSSRCRARRSTTRCRPTT